MLHPSFKLTVTGCSPFLCRPECCLNVGTSVRRGLSLSSRIECVRHRLAMEYVTLLVFYSVRGVVFLTYVFCPPDLSVSCCCRPHWKSSPRKELFNDWGGRGYDDSVPG